MSISRALRQETLVEHLLSLSLQEIGLGLDDLTAAHKKEISSGIAADLTRFRHADHFHHQESSSRSSRFPSDRRKEAKIQRQTLVKKWAALIQHQLPSKESLASHRHRSATAPPLSNAAETEDGQRHKPNVERMLQKHQRDLEWSDMVMRDAESVAAEREAAKQRKESMIRQQRNVLDRQVDARRSEVALRKQREVEEMRELMRKQEEDEVIEKKKLAELRQREMEKLKQAQEFTTRVAAEQARQREEEKRAEKAAQLQQQKEEAQRKDDERKRRSRAQEQIRNFVVENEALMQQKRAIESEARAREDRLGGTQVYVLPSGEGRDPDAHFLEKQELLLAKRRVAEQAYLEKVQKRQRDVEEREQREKQNQDLIVRKDQEKQQLEKEKNLVRKHQYYADLARQVEQKKVSEQQSREQEKIARQEIELCVRFGDAEEQKLQNMMRVMRGRNLQFLKLQMEAQKRLRESFDVCPKLV